MRSSLARHFLGQIWDRNQFFLCDFRPVSPKQFTRLSCSLALTLGEFVRVVFGHASVAVPEPPC